MAKIGGTPTRPTASFKIWKVPEDADDGRTPARGNPEIGEWRSRVNEHPVGCSTGKQVPKMTKFPRRCVSKEAPAAEITKKTPENLRIPADSPKAPLKPRRAAKKLDGVPKRLEFPEAEDENADSIDSGFIATPSSVTHRYLTRAKVSGRTTQSYDENRPKISNSRAAKPKRNKNLPDFDKENDASAANGAEPRRATSLNKKRSGLPANRPVSPNLAMPDDLNFMRKQLSEGSNTEWKEYMQWLQQQRDIGLWIECCRKGCGKWRYVEEYHDPLGVPKEWFCEMNADARFADCSIPEAEMPEAEIANQIENAYNAGSIVWAKINGYPWWPAMVDDCPRLLRYFETRGSSIVPYKYHVKFFNEMKIAWVMVRGLKPYAENPRSTFLKRKKMIFWTKDYTEELNAACELTDQALSLSLRQRLEKFSWAALYSNVAREEQKGLGTKEVPPKKKISARNLTNGATKRPAKNNMTSIADKTMLKHKTINVKSRIVNVETERVVNRGSASPHSICKMRITVVPRCTALESKSPGCPTCPDKTTILEPIGLFEDNSNKRDDIDNLNIDNGLVTSPPSKSISSQNLKTPTGSCEKRKRVEPANSESCNKRLHDIGGKPLEKSNLDVISTRHLINLMCGYQHSSLTEELGTSRSDDAKEATRFGGGSGTNVFAVTEEPARSPWEPMDCALTDDSTDCEYPDTEKASSSSIRRNFETHGKRFSDGSNETMYAGTVEPSASIRDPFFIDLTKVDRLNYSESQSACRLSDHTFASTSEEYQTISGSIMPFSQPQQDELYERLPSFPDLGVRFRESSISTHFSPVSIRQLTSPSWESEDASSLQTNSDLSDRGSISGYEVIIPDDAVESSPLSSEPILIDLTDPCMDYQGYYDRQEYLNYPSHLVSRSNSNSSNLTFGSTLNECCSLSIERRSRSHDSVESSESIVPSSQQEEDELYEQQSRFPGLCLAFKCSNISAPSSPMVPDCYWLAPSSSDNLIEEIIIHD